MTAPCHLVMPRAASSDDHGRPVHFGGGGPFAHWLTRAELAALLGYRPDTLARWAAQETGPAFANPGRRVLYRVAAVEEWLLHLESRCRRPWTQRP